MKAVWCLGLGLCAIANAQQDSADRSIVAPSTQPFRSTNFVARMLHPLEPTKYTPLTPKQRFHDYIYQTVGPYTIFRELVLTGFNQGMNSPHEWGQGASGFATRFASNMGGVVVHTTITYGLATAFHEDNRYFASHQSSKKRRVLHAALGPFEARHDDGHFGFSYSNVAGVVGTGFISRLWAPPSWQGAGNISRAIGYTFLGEAAFDIFREFLPDLLHHRQD
jgi:hypothetical protein